MTRMRSLTALLLLSSAAVLPGCSMFGNQNGQQEASYTLPQPAGVSVDTIRQAQAQLKQEGDYNGNIDGVWGPSTQVAVRSYQQRHNLPQTAQLDSQTVNSLNLSGQNQMAGSPQAATMPQGSNISGGANDMSGPRGQMSARHGASRDTIMQAQAQLKQDGTYNGNIDGRWGPATQAAVRSYQQHNNLPQSGQLDSKTMEAMNLSGHSQTMPGAAMHGAAATDTMAPAPGASMPQGTSKTN